MADFFFFFFIKVSMVMSAQLQMLCHGTETLNSKLICFSNSSQFTWEKLEWLLTPGRFTSSHSSFRLQCEWSDCSDGQSTAHSCQKPNQGAGSGHHHLFNIFSLAQTIMPVLNEHRSPQFKKKLYLQILDLLFEEGWKRLNHAENTEYYTSGVMWHPSQSQRH